MGRLFLVAVALFAVAGSVAAVVLLVLWLTRKGRDADARRPEERD